MAKWSDTDKRLLALTVLTALLAVCVGYAKLTNQPETVRAAEPVRLDSTTRSEGDGAVSQVPTAATETVCPVSMATVGVLQLSPWPVVSRATPYTAGVSAQLLAQRLSGESFALIPAVVGRRLNTDGHGRHAGTEGAAIRSAGAESRGLRTVESGRGSTNTATRLLAAIRKVESGGNDRAVGDGGRSRGPFQIQLAYWLDSGGKRSDYLVRVWDAGACERRIVAYWKRYCPAALARGDWETLARVHNGGPGGMAVRATAAYWRRVKAAMEGDRR